jgi:uncharacterized surface protein with fasciclin (FAS1) repeats
MRKSKKVRVAVVAMVAAATTLLGFSVGAGAATSADPTKDIVGTAVDAGNFKTFVSLLEKSGLDKMLMTGGPYTVFAPTDDAFANAPASMMNAFANDAALLKSALLYDIVAGDVSSTAAKTIHSTPTLNGAMLGLSVVGDSVYANNAKVVSADLLATNGRIHSIDTVLMPLASYSGTDRHAGYCAVAGNTTPAGEPIPAGKFLDLYYGQPTWDYHYAGATVAVFIQGHGLTCEAPPTGYVRMGTAPDELNVPGGLYAYYVKG